VVFGDTGPLVNSYIVNVASGGVSALAVNVNTVHTYQFIGGAITGPLTNQNTGTVIIDNTDALGVVTITKGIVQIGNNDANGNLGAAASVSVASGSTLLFDRSDSSIFSNVISGAGAVIQDTGSITLNGLNTYTGATTVNGGILNLAKGTYAGPLTVNAGGTLNFTGGTINSAAGNVATVNLNGIVNVGSGAATVGGLTGAGLVQNGGTTGTDTLAISSSTTSNTFSGLLTDGGNGGKLSLFVTHTATLTGVQTLSGVNTYTGGTTIANGATLAIAGDTSINSGIGGLTFGTGGGVLEFNGSTSALNYTDASKGGILSNTGQNLSFQAASTTTLTGIVNTSGTLGTAGGTIIIAPGATNATADAWGGTNLTGGTLQIGNGTAFGATTAGNPIAYVGTGAVTASNATLSFDVANNLTVANAISQGASAANIIQAGTGTTLLSAANSYTGTTTINAGTLQVGNVGALGSGASSASGATNGTVTLGAAGTLDLNGMGSSTSGVIVGALGGTTGSIITNSATSTTGFLEVGNKSNSSSTYSGTISGNVGLITNGSGTLTLNGSAGNTYTGGTILNTGSTLAITADKELPSTSGVTWNGGTLQLNNYTSGLTFTSGNVQLGAASGTAATLGAAASSAGTTVTPATINLSGASTNLVFAGPGTLVLAGNNTYGGTTTISGGELSISGNATGATNIGAGAITLNGGDLQITGTSITSLNSAAASSASNLANALTWGASSGLDIASSSDDVLVSGAITGETAFTKLGAGTLSLTSSNQFGANSAVGLTISAGTLDLGGNSQSIGALAGSGATIDNLSSTAATLTIGAAGVTASSTYSGVIKNSKAGAISLVKTGPGTETLSGANTYGGGTTIAGGTLAITADAALGSTAGPITFSGGTLQLNNYSSSLKFGNQSVTLGAAANTASTIAAGFIAGTSVNALNYVGPGTLILSGANTYTGGTTITGGILGIAGDTSINSGIGGLTFGTGGSLEFTGATSALNYTDSSKGGILSSMGQNLSFLSSSSTTLSGVVNSTGSLGVSSGTIIIAAAAANTVADSWGVTNLTGGTLQIGSGSTTFNPITFMGTGAVSVSNATLAFDDANALTVSNVITQGASTANITQLGAGTTLLSSANSYTGATTITAGTLQVGNVGSLGSGASTVGAATNGTLTLAAAGTLDLNGIGTSTSGVIVGALSGVTGSKIINSSATTGFLDVGNKNNSSSTYSGAITGNVGLITNGTGTLTLNGSAGNTYTGGTILNTGSTLAITADKELPSTAGITWNGGTLLLNNYASGLTFASGAVKIGAASGASSTLGTASSTNLSGSTTSLTFAGPGTLVLAGDNTYGGTTTISGGELSITSNAAGDTNIGTGTIALNGGDLQITGNTISSLNANAASSASNLANTLTWAGSSGLDIATAANTVSVGTAIGGTTFSKIGAGALQFGTANQFGANSAVNVSFTGGMVNVAGLSSSVGSLNGSSLIDNLSSNAATLTIGTNATTTAATNSVYTGIIQNSQGGALSLVKNGTGSLTLSPSNNINTYSGGTTINGGTVIISTDAALGGVVTNPGVTFGGGALQFNNYTSIDNFNEGSALTHVALGASTGTASVLSGAISGANTSLNFVGPGTLILTGITNSYGGATLITGGSGELSISSLANIGTGNVNLNGGTLQITGAVVRNLPNLTNSSFLGANTLDINSSANVFTVNTAINGSSFTKIGGGTLVLTNSNNGMQAFVDNGGTVQLGDGTAGDNGNLGVGTVSLGASTASLVLNENGSQTIGNAISGSGSITQLSAATTTLTGANTYTGSTTVTAGTLQLSPTGSINTTSNGSVLSVAQGATFALNGGTATDAGLTGPGTIENGAASGIANLAVTVSTASSTFSGTLADGGAGKLALTVNHGSSSGTQTLSGINTYTGGTTITGGSLIISSDAAIANGAGVGLKFAGGTLEFGSSQSALNYTDTGTNAAGILSSAGQSPSFQSTGTTTLTGIINTAATVNSVGGTIIIAPSAANTTADAWNATNLSGGTLQIGNGVAFGSTTAGNPINYMGSGPIAINNSSLTFDVSNNLTLANVITQGATSSNINQNGTGTLLISSANSYTGSTTINAGILQVGNVGSLGAGAGTVNSVKNGTVTVNALGTLDLNGVGSGTGTAAPGLIVGGLSGSGIVTNSSSLAAYINVGNTANISSTFSGVIQNGAAGGTVALIRNNGTVGTGVFTLNGTVANNYTGGTTIDAGILAITADNLIGTTTSNAATSTSGPTTTINGGINWGGGTLQLNNYNSSLAFMANSAGTVTLGAASGTASTLGSAAIAATSTSAAVAATANIAGTSSLVYTGPGTLILAGNNSYSGTTSITAGELSVSQTQNLGTGVINIGVAGSTTAADLQVTGSNITSIGSAGGTTAGTTTASSLGNVITWAGTTGLDIQTTNDVDVLGPITGETAFTKLGAGEMDLTQSNQFGVGSSVSLVLSAGITDFNGNSESAGSLTGTGTIDNKSFIPVNFIVGNGNSTASFGGVIQNSVGGALSLSKVGLGTFTLTGANTYSGGTFVNVGTVAVGADSALGTGPVTFSPGASLQLNNYNSNLKFGTQNVTLAAATGNASSINSGFITNSGSLTYIGTGTLSLNASVSSPNSYTGATNIQAGILAIGTDSAIGNPNAIKFQGGILQLNNYTSNNLNFGGTQNVNLGAASGTASTLNENVTTTGSLTFNGPGTLVLTGANTYGATAINAGTLQVGAALGTTGTLGTGAVTDNGAIVLDRIDSGYTLSNNISGSGTIQQFGSGTTTLSGNNIYTGGTIASNGTLKLGSATALGNASNSLTFSSGSTAIVDLNGNAQSIGALSGTTGNITNSGGAVKTLTVGTGTAAVSNTAFGGTITGNIGLTTAGLGTLNLTSANTYTGPTALNGGVLGINSDAAINSASPTFGGGELLFNNYTSALSLSGTQISLGGAAGVSTLTGNITGSTSALTYNGPGILVLAGTNSGYAGTTTIKGGELSIGSAGNIGTGAINLNGGYLQITGGTLSSLPNTFNWSGTSGLDITAGTFSAGSAPIGGTIFTKAGAGALQLGETNQFGVVGATALLVNGGLLDVHGFSQNLGLLEGSGTIDNLTSTPATLVVGINNVSPTFAGTIQNSNTTTASGGSISLYKVGTGTLTLSGANTYSGGTTLYGQGTLAITNDAALGTGPVNFAGGVLQFNNYTSLMNFNEGSAATVLSLGAASNTTSALDGSISGINTSLNFVGPGTLALGGTNTYGAGTLVTGGELSIGSTTALGAGAVNLDGGTLQITGTAVGALSNSLNFLGSNTLDIESPTANPFTVSSSIGGASLAKTGPGTLILTGSNSVLGITVSAGALQVGNGGTTGNLGSGNVTDNAILSFDESGTLAVNNIISGSGSVTQAGSGTLVVGVINTYTGGTTISTGTVQLGNATATLGSSSGGVAIAGGATLDLHGFNANVGTLAGSGTVDTLAAGTPTLTVGTGNGGAEFDGVIQNTVGTLALNKTGTGTIILTGANTYGGGTTIGGGILAITQDSAVNNGVGNINFTGGTLQFGGSAAVTGYTSSLNFGGSQNINLGAALGSSILAGNVTTSGSLTYVGPGNLALTGTNTYAGGTIITAGLLQVGNGGTTGSLGTGPVANGTNLAFDRSDASLTVANTISGVGNITQAGTGTLQLSGNNTGYSGTTFINSGEVQLGSATALGTGAVAVNTAAPVGLDLNGFSPALGGLQGTGVVDNTSSTPVTLSVTGNGSFAGTVQNSGGALTLAVNTGFGTLTLTGSGNYTGGTQLNSGTLQISSDAAINSVAPAMNGGTLLFSGYTSNFSFNNVAALNLASSGTSTLQGNITGTSALNLQGNSPLILIGTNNYTGGTTIGSAATLVIGSTTALGSPSSALVIGGGELDLNGFNATIGSLSGNGTIDNLSLSGGSNVNLTVGNSANTEYDGIIKNTVATFMTSLTKVETGTLTLTNAASTYTGGTFINGGTIAVTNDSALGGSAAAVTFGGGTLQLNNYTSSFGFGSQNVSLGAATGAASSINPGFVSGPGSLTFVGPGTLDLSGTNTYTGSTNINGGALAIADDAAINNGVGGITFAGSGATAGNLQFLNYASALSFAQSATLGAAAGTASSISGSITDGASLPSNLTFEGPGILALSGTNTYSGVTTISGGELSIGATTNIGTGAIAFNGGDLQITLPITGTAISSLNAGSATSASNLGNALTWTGNNGLDIGAGNTVAVASSIGGVNFTKLGAGELSLASANSYTGTTTVSTGTLQLAATGALPTGTSVSVAGGATLDLNSNSPTVNGLSGPGTIDNLGSSPVTLTLGVNNATSGFPGTIQNSNGSPAAVSVTKAGTGVITLGGTNTYLGATNINAGTLGITSDAAINNGVGGVNFNGGILQLNNYASNLSFPGTSAVVLGAAAGAQATLGSGGATGTTNVAGGFPLTYVGPGTLILAGNNTYAGGTVINSGVLGITSDAAINSSVGGVTFNGTGTLQLVNSSGTYVSNFSLASANLNLGAATGNTAVLNGTIADNGATKTVLNFVGPGTLALTGTNTYTGATNLGGGELSIGSTSNINAASALNFQGGILQITGTTITSLTPGLVAAGNLPNTINNTAFNGGIDVASAANIVTLGNTSATVGAEILSGTGALSKLGAGTLVLTAPNTNTGGTFITAGTLQLSGVGALAGTAAVTMSGGTLDIGAITSTSSTIGTLSGFGSVIDSAGTTVKTLVEGNGNGTSTFAGTLTGSLALNKTGTGTLTVSGINTYTGGTTISLGTLALGNNSALGSAASGMTIGSNAATAASLDLHGFSPTIASLSTGVVTAANFSIDNLSTTASVLTIQNTSTAALTFNNGVIKSTTGSLALVLNTPGSLALNGANTYTGGTTINAGTLIVGNGTALGSANGSLTISAGAAVNLNNNTLAVGVLTGSGTIGNSASTSRALTVGSNNVSSTFAGTIGGSVGTSMSLIKTGTGTLTLTGTNTYNGSTTISGGILAITSDGGIGAATNPNPTLSFSGGGILQFNNYTSGLTFNNNTSALTLGAAAATPSALNGPITGNTSLTFVGPGILALNGINNYTGGTTLSGSGELSISSLANIGFNSSLTYSATLPPPSLTFSGGILQVTNPLVGTELTNLNALAFLSGSVSTPTVNWNSFNGGFDIADPANVFTISTQIGNTASNGGSLTKTGPGTLVLTAFGASANSYKSTIITGGTLQIGDGGADGSLGNGSGGSVSFGSTAAAPVQALAFDSTLPLTISEPITGAGTVVQEGLGTTTLTSTSNTFSQGAVISNGILSITSQASLGTPAAGVLPATFTGGVLQLNNKSGSLPNTTLQFGQQNAVIGVVGTVQSGTNIVTGTGSLTLVGNSSANSTLNMASPSTYSGGTVIGNSTPGVLTTLSDTSSSSATGTGPVTINNNGLLTTITAAAGNTASQTNITGDVIVNSGGDLAYGHQAFLNGGLTLNNGGMLSTVLGAANIAATTFKGPTDLAVLEQPGEALVLNPGVTVNVGETTGFGSDGFYSLIFSETNIGTTITDHSNNFSGWMLQMTGGSTSNNFTSFKNTYFDFSNNNVVGNSDIVLNEVNDAGTPPTLTSTSGPVFIVQAIGQQLDSYAANTNSVTAPGPTVTAAGTNFFITNQPYSGTALTTKTNSFQLVTSTVFGAVAYGGQAGTVQDPQTVNVYSSGFEYLSSAIAYVDPPATPTPHYIGESFSPVGGERDVFLAVLANGEWENAVAPDANTGGDASRDYNGSFLTYVDSLFPGTTDPALLPSTDWSLIDGAWGVDSTGDVAWAVSDYATGGDYAVLGLVGVGTISTPLPNSLLGGLALMLGMGYVTWRKMRHAA
jgi:autotransporter-associated beta strand protein